MPPTTNHLGQPIGFAVPDWVPAKPPPRLVMEGRWCRVEPLDVTRHGAELFAAYAEDTNGRIWTYMGYGPFETHAEFETWMAASCLGDDPLFHAIVEGASGRALGMASYLRAVPETGVIEVGHINHAPALQRSAAATEAMVLMMARVFDELGNRRYEWKCDALNVASRAAAERLGFSFEGVFRQATLYKGRNRDTAWYAITDRDWPALKTAYQAWLDPANFDAEGRQKARLSAFMPEARR
jgi:RimJ/RimL family protein N-acetyltransferase